MCKTDIENKIKNKQVEHEIINHGNINRDNFIVKYEVNTKLITVVTEHRFYLGTNGKYNIPKQFKNEVCYGADIKSICSLLSVEASVPINKITSVISSLTNNILNLSEGTIVNFLCELKNKSVFCIDKIRTKLLNSNLMYTDETSSKCDGNRISVRNYSNKYNTLYMANKSKSKACIESNNILNVFTGDVVHDHESVMYNFGNRNIECNIHICRYLKGNTQNTLNRWSEDMKTFLNMLNRTKKIAIEFGLKQFDKKDLEKYNRMYDNIIEIGFLEAKLTSSVIYKKEEIKLLNRLKKYKENHLLFIHDFSLPFDNNLSERDIRVFKTKTKVSGGFRSDLGVQAFVSALSIIKTARKQGKNCLKTLSNIYKYSTANI